MNIVLSRHGNTFGPNDPVVWAGSTNDLPLVESGFIQAENFARALIDQGVKPAAIYCSPLKRTNQYAEVIVKKLGLHFQPKIDIRIHEIDYGDWAGLTNEQVIAQFGEAALKNWDEHCQWPDIGNWGGSPSKLISEVQSFVDDLVQRHDDHDTVIVITSNGRLRYFLNLVPDEFQKRVQGHTFKVRTGHICGLTCHDHSVQIRYWNVEPIRAIKI